LGNILNNTAYEGNMNGKLLTIDQVAEYLGVHRDTVYSLVKSGRLPALQLGGRKAGWRIGEDDVHAFVADGKATTASQTNGDEKALDEFARRQQEERDAFETNQQRERQQFLLELQQSRTSSH
jgi:excisionase family DNA binding protein